MCESSVYLVHLNFVYSGDVTKQIVILKKKFKPVSINAAANYNEHIFYDIMMQCLQSSHCLRNIQMFMTKLPN